MIRHLLILIWNRKRSTMLLAVEILLCFFVLFAVSSLFLYNVYHYRQPLGFDYQNVWEINIDPKRIRLTSINSFSLPCSA
ncbi:hypothetical protein [Hymenobacter cellulosilyticus]|uniref:Uncharacterized protein n=1 Tax=Hymenobacter cellulosilyticus TaxID=2932248 RepID=A0A8T9QBK4_9BACT|nr:hypothetical protein [Hymenobacter cellulosilyticus]UOQ72919.1 hypothetical protein MUN79_02735 [Hymenobacter cellulosilyticus]